MKKILGVLLVILMLFAFVACDTGNSSNGGVTGDTTIDASDLDFDIEVSALPEVTGTDPFANVKTLYGESYVYEYYEYYKVDSENKIFTTPCFMLDSTLKDIYNDAYNMVEALAEAL